MKICKAFHNIDSLKANLLQIRLFAKKYTRGKIELESETQATKGRLLAASAFTLMLALNPQSKPVTFSGLSIDYPLLVMFSVIVSAWYLINFINRLNVDTKWKNKSKIFNTVSVFEDTVVKCEKTLKNIRSHAEENTIYYSGASDNIKEICQNIENLHANIVYAVQNEMKKIDELLSQFGAYADDARRSAEQLYSDPNLKDFPDQRREIALQSLLSHADDCASHFKKHVEEFVKYQREYFFIHEKFTSAQMRLIVSKGAGIETHLKNLNKRVILITSFLNSKNFKLAFMMQKFRVLIDLYFWSYIDVTIPLIFGFYAIFEGMYTISSANWLAIISKTSLYNLLID